ncbi:MAG TPA: response regulator [Sideroxyarcus sp.]|nr:response regulator [Sideroxyarcus sp.]
MSDTDIPAEATILVVDDSPPNAKLLRIILGAAGYRVLDAYSGADALEIMRREKPDAMLLDVRMPGMTGYEVCKKVREDPEFASLPVIMVTALSLSEERIQGIEAGATDFISKPFNKKELLARVRASLAMAKYGKSGILPQLPGAVLIADPAWKILAMSPLAAVLLDIPTHASLQTDFTQMLGQREQELLAAGGELVDFQLHRRITLTARQSLVINPEGKLALRLITLSKTAAG